MKSSIASRVTQVVVGVPHHFLDRVPRGSGRSARGAIRPDLHEHAHRQAKLVARRVDAAEHGQDDHVVELLIAERVLVLVGLQRLGNEIVAGRPCAALLDHPVSVFEQGFRCLSIFSTSRLKVTPRAEAHVAALSASRRHSLSIEAEQEQITRVT